MTSTGTHVTVSSPPLSRAARLATGLCLLAAGLTNGLGQYLGELAKPRDLEDFSAQIRWGVDHPTLHGAEQTVMVLSMLFLPLGFLGLAHLTRWASPRLTAVAVALTLWGMWGFHNVVALGYGAGTVGPGAIGTRAAVSLNDAYVEHPGVLVLALLPHLVGSFVGLLLLAVAGLRTRTLPRAPFILLLAFLVWDFLLPALPPLEPHLLLAISLGWLGTHLLRIPSSSWEAPEARPAA